MALADAIAAHPRSRTGRGVDPPGRGRRRRAGRPPLHRPAAGAVRRHAGLPGRGRPPPPDDPRGQLGRHHRHGRLPTPSGAVRHRPLRRGPLPVGGRRPGRRRRRRPPPGALPPHPGHLRPPAGRRRAPLLRAAPGPGPPVHGGHRPHRLRRRRPPSPLRPGRGGADRWDPPTAGRRGHHGPDRHRLRARSGSRRWRWATRWCCSGRQGSEEITATEWADLLGTIPYEVLCGIGPRVPRRVLDGGVERAVGR